MKWLKYGLILLGFMSLSCGLATVVTNPPIPTTTKLVSSSLSSASAALSLRMMMQGLSTDCGGSVQCLTPTNVTGKIYYSGITVGTVNSYSVGPIVGDIIDPSTITSFAEEDLLDFDFGQQLAVGGGIVCCGGSPYPADSEAIAQRIESYFGYIDVVFSLTETDGVTVELQGTHTIRTIYGDIDGTELKKGDLLYKGVNDSDFKWCTTSEGCVHTTRPGNPIQNLVVATFSGTPDQMGNQTIPAFAVQLPDAASKIQMTESQILNNSWAFTIDFNMTNGLVFSQDITTLTQVQELVAAFDLSADPGNTDGGFMATLAATKTPTSE